MTRDLTKARKLYVEFHQFDPVDEGEFCPGFEIPTEAFYVGEARTMFYTSNKLNPETGKDEGSIRYFHPHEGDVQLCITDENDIEGEWMEIPEWIHEVTTLVLLGQCDGYKFKDLDGRIREAEATGRKPEWYCIPSGRALLVIQDKRRVLAIVWGGELNVEWRGVVG